MYYDDSAMFDVKTFVYEIYPTNVREFANIRHGSFHDMYWMLSLPKHNTACIYFLICYYKLKIRFLH